MRSEEYLEEFSPVLDSLEPEVKEMVLSGDFEICPACQQISAYNWNQCNAYTEFPDGNVPFGKNLPKGTIAHISTASGYEWECGHCKKNWMEANSPLNSECYTH